MRTFDGANILVLDHHGIGDVIMSLPLLDGLRAGYPRARIDVVVKSDTEASLVRTSGVNRTILFHRENMGIGRWGVFLGGIFCRYHLLVAPVNTNARAANWLGRIAYIGTRVGHGSGQGYTVSVPMPHRHKVDNNLEILRALGLPVITQFPVLRLEQGVSRPSVLPEEGLPVLALHVGTGILIGPRRFDYSIAAYKQIAVSTFREVVEAVRQYGRFSLLLVGSGEDKKRADALASWVPADVPVLNMAGACSILETAALLRTARVFLGGDSGLSHLAAAVGVPVVALFGPTDPEITGPYGKDVRVFRSSSCPLAPCYPRKIYDCRWPAPDSLSPGQQVRTCVASLDPRLVAQAISERMFDAARLQARPYAS